MKKSRIIALVAVALVAVMILSSCGSSAVTVKSFIDKKAEFVDTTATINSSTRIPELDGAMGDTTQAGDLVYYVIPADIEKSIYEKHVIYNLATGTVVHTATEHLTKNVTIVLDATIKGDAYFVETVRNWQLDGDAVLSGSESYVTTLYSGSGRSVTNVNKDMEAELVCDTVFFNGACYRANEDGELEYAFDYSSLADVPEADYMYKNRYYDLSETYVAVYNNKFELISRYLVPAYASYSSHVILENGNVLVQLGYKADALSEDYDLIVFNNEGLSNEGLKIYIDTMIIDAKKGTAKEIECNYMITEEAFNIKMYEELGFDFYAGINSDKYPVYANAILIENKRITVDLFDEESNALRVVSIKNDGKMTELELINGEPIFDISMIAEERWMVETVYGHTYLLNKNGKILGDISNGSYRGGYIASNGKLYNLDLEEVYDFGANDLAIEDSTESAIVFEGDDGEIFVYGKDGVLRTLADKDSNTSVWTVSDRYIVLEIKNNDGALGVTKTEYKVYNQDGEFIAEFDNAVYLDIESDEAIIVYTHDGTLGREYYRFN